MVSPKYRIPWGLRRALEVSPKQPTCLWSVNNLLMVKKYLKILKTLDTVEGSLEIDECHYRQLLKLGLYLKEFERVQFGSGSRKYNCSIWVEKLKRNRQFKVHLSEHWFTRFLEVSDLLKVFQEERETRYFLKILTVCEDWVTVRACQKFCQKFDECYASPKKYTLEIDCGYYFFQHCHRTLDRIEPSTVSCIFFPKKTNFIFQQSNFCSTWFNAKIANDLRQKQAVYNIVNKSAFPAPYILCGPPGSGKTTTLVETICQIWKQRSSNCILVCASADVACDAVIKTLLKFIPNANDLYRIYGDLHDVDKIDEDTNYQYSYDALNRIDTPVRKIIITNWCTAWRLQKFQLSFSHIFIDEASQATQVETLTLLSLLEFSDQCQIVLSGDDLILEPDFYSWLLSWKIFGQSILEKLMNQEPYQKDPVTGYDPRYITKFIRNYRSFTEIVQISNQLFYNSEIISCGNQNISSALIGISVYLVKDGAMQLPFDFRSVCNLKEVNKVLSLVESFIGRRVNGKIIEGKDIGIITLYPLQITKIREELKKIGLQDIDVGGAKSFQGQEKEVIIISTVQSKCLEDRWTAKSFNIAMTRAKSSLLILGDQRALQADIYWGYLLKFHLSKISTIGDPLLFSNKLAFKIPVIPDGRVRVKSIDLFDETLTKLKIDDERTIVSSILTLLIIIIFFLVLSNMPYLSQLLEKPKTERDDY